MIPKRRQTGRRPGKMVQLPDGRVGRTYNDEPLVAGKVRVYILARSMDDVTRGTVGDNYGKALCDPTTLKVIGMAD